MITTIGVFWRIGLAAIILFATGDLAWSQSDERTKLVEAAKKEGKLNWYTSTNTTESKPLLDDFEKAYGIKGEIIRASGEKTLNRIVTEGRAGRWDFDVVTISEVDALTDAKLLMAYRSPEAKTFIPEFKDANGYWTAVYVNYTTIGYNTKLVSEKEAPKQWEDLLDPKWKGKISIDQEPYTWFGTLHKAWGRERAQKYMRAIAKQDIQWRKGHTLIAQLMSAGEFPIGVVYAAPHRRDENPRRADRVGEHREPSGGHTQLSRYQRKAAASQRGARVCRLFTIQACATAFALVAAYPSAAGYRTVLAAHGAIEIQTGHQSGGNRRPVQRLDQRVPRNFWTIEEFDDWQHPSTMLRADGHARRKTLYLRRVVNVELCEESVMGPSGKSFSLLL